MSDTCINYLLLYKRRSVTGDFNYILTRIRTGTLKKGKHYFIQHPVSVFKKTYMDAIWQFSLQVFGRE